MSTTDCAYHDRGLADRALSPAPPSAQNIRLLKRAAYRHAGHFGVRLVEAFAGLGVVFATDAKIAEWLSLEVEGGGRTGVRGKLTGLREALDRLVRGGVLLRYHARPAKGGGPRRTLRVLLWGDPAEGGLEMRRPAFADDAAAALVIPGPDGRPRTLKIGADLKEAPAAPARSRAFEKSRRGVIEKSRRDVISYSEPHADSPTGEAAASAAAPFEPQTAESSGASTTTTGPDSIEAETLASKRSETAPGSTTPMLTADLFPTVTPDPTATAHGSTFEAPTAAAPVTPAKTPKRNAGAVFAAWCDAWRSKTGAPWAVRKVDPGHAKTLFALAPDPDLWAEVFAAALADRFIASSPDPLALIVKQRNALARRFTKRRDDIARERQKADDAAARIRELEAPTPPVSDETRKALRAWCIGKAVTK